MRLKRALILAILLSSGCTPILQQLPLPDRGELPVLEQAATRTPFQPLAVEPATPVFATVGQPAASVTPTFVPPSPTVAAATTPVTATAYHSDARNRDAHSDMGGSYVTGLLSGRG